MTTAPSLGNPLGSLTKSRECPLQRVWDDYMVFLLWLFRGEITPLSSSYNISGLVPVCWLLFQ